MTSCRCIDDTMGTPPSSTQLQISTQTGQGEKHPQKERDLDTRGRIKFKTRTTLKDNEMGERGILICGRIKK